MDASRPALGRTPPEPSSSLSLSSAHESRTLLSHLRLIRLWLHLAAEKRTIGAQTKQEKKSVERDRTDPSRSAIESSKKKKEATKWRHHSKVSLIIPISLRPIMRQQSRLLARCLTSATVKRPDSAARPLNTLFSLPAMNPTGAGTLPLAESFRRNRRNKRADIKIVRLYRCF